MTQCGVVQRFRRRAYKIARGRASPVPSVPKPKHHTVPALSLSLVSHHIVARARDLHALRTNGSKSRCDRGTSAMSAATDGSAAMADNGAVGGGGGGGNLRMRPIPCNNRHTPETYPVLVTSSNLE